MKALGARAVLTMVTETLLRERCHTRGSAISPSTLLGFAVAIGSKTLEPPSAPKRRDRTGS
jgi:hypothetical protein